MTSDKKFGHSRDGYQCAPEICGGSRSDPCTYSPAEIARFELIEDANTAGSHVTPPTEPGWYAYTEGRQLMVFHLREIKHIPGEDDRLQWSAHFDNTDCGDCEWGYIEQALGGANRLVRIDPPPTVDGKIPMPAGELDPKFRELLESTLHRQVDALSVTGARLAVEAIENHLTSADINADARGYFRSRQDLVPELDELAALRRHVAAQAESRASAGVVLRDESTGPCSCGGPARDEDPWDTCNNECGNRRLPEPEPVTDGLDEFRPVEIRVPSDLAYQIRHIDLTTGKETPLTPVRTEDGEAILRFDAPSSRAVPVEPVEVLDLPDTEYPSELDRTRGFYLWRETDVTEVTVPAGGEARCVAVGVQFPDGQCALWWVPPADWGHAEQPRTSVAVWPEIGFLEATHLHPRSSTKIVWVD